MVQKVWVWGILLPRNGAKERPAEEATLKLTLE